MGLATLARQYGVPPNLRYRVWPILLKYHPYVIDPFIDATVENDADMELDLKRMNNDINKYFKIRTTVSSNDPDRIKGSPHDVNLSPVEEEIIRIIKATITKFFSKWGAIVKYDSGFTWIALNLAEWFPPIPDSNYVLIGRNCINKNNNNTPNRYLTQITDSINNNQEFNLDDDSTSTTNSETSTYSSSSTTTTTTTTMSFSEVFERLVLVLLHSQNVRDENHDDDEAKESDTIKNKEEIIFKSGNVQKRLKFFINALSKLQPELFKLLSEEEFLLSNSKSNNEWLTWWLKYCGAKILNKIDRGRLWDLLLGFRLNYKAYDNKYKHHLNSKHLKLFKKFYSHDKFKDNELFKIDEFWFTTSNDTRSLKWSQIDYQYQLVFIFISILHKNESKLLEIDQAEMIEFLSNLNFKENGLHLNAGNPIGELSVDYNNGNIQKAIIEAGDLWRNWLWHELRDEFNDQ